MESPEHNEETRSGMSPSLSSGLRLTGLVAFVGGSIWAAHAFASGAPLWTAAAAFTTLAGMVAMAEGMRRELMAGRTRLTTPERSRLRYDQWHGFWVIGYVFSFVLAVNVAPSLENLLAKSALIAVPMILLVGMVSEFVRMIVKSDERQRAQHITASAIGAGTLVVSIAAWGTLGELMGGWPSPPGWTLLPSFAIVYAIALSVLNRGET
ncbi:hypothetical protein [Hyphobacterium sp.]|jgi:hypothetical protein|uniref:hypothetical protein n=1 Tax=Hyphobacterium sp. TaxID=2004662 RepID=UPI003BADADF5